MITDFETQYFALLDRLISDRERFVSIRDTYRARSQENGIPNGTRMGCATKANTLSGVIARFDFVLARNRKQIEARWGEAAYPLKQ
jgi:hypothetical protein